METTYLTWLLLTPLTFSVIAFASRWLGTATRFLAQAAHLISVILVLVLSLLAVSAISVSGPILALGGWLHLDSLGAVFLLIIPLMLVTFRAGWPNAKAALIIIAIVGGSACIATGAALAAKQNGSGQVAVCFFGEGALGQGLFYEVMNLAQLWKLPVIYVCENNQYNEYTHYTETTAGELLARAQAFGIHTESVNGQDVRAVYTTMAQLVDRARRGDGPAFLLCDTYRYRGHHVGDINRTYYRSKEEEEEWATQRDPLKTLAGALISQKLTDQGVLDRIHIGAKAEIEAAAQFAIDAPYPDVSQVNQHVYA